MTNPAPDRAALLRAGCVIPACPLALDPERRFDPRGQRALFRYYAAAGAGGVAVGVHTTQFEIRDAPGRLFERVLRLGAETIDAEAARHGRPILRIAGICGPAPQATAEADLAAALGYDLGLVSFAALRDADDDALLRHCAEVGERIPVMGFYLQPAVGGRPLSCEFWRRLTDLPALRAIKIAPFDRYRTLDVIRAVASCGRAGGADDPDAIALYTGNDDSIVADLLTPFPGPGGDLDRPVRIRGGLLGQWAVGTRAAVDLLDRIHRADDADLDAGHRPDLLTVGAALTEINAAVFDAAHAFAGCIPGIHHVLWRQGLLESVLALDPDVRLSPGQADEIDRVCRTWPHLVDDTFVRDNLDEWLD